MACLVRVVPPGQGIADELAARRKAESKVAKGFPRELRRQIYLVDETSPGDIAGITRDDLGRLEARTVERKPSAPTMRSASTNPPSAKCAATLRIRRVMPTSCRP
jgi:hypothetical protein